MSAEVVTAIATVGATVVSVVAVFVAAKAASAADRSAEAAASTLHRAAVRELVTVCHELVAEDLRIQSLAPELKAEYTAMAVFTGNSGGSVERELKAKLDRSLADAAERAKDAHALAADASKLIEASDAHISEKHARLESNRVFVRNVREDMVRELEEVRRQNAIYREQRTR